MTGFSLKYTKKTVLIYPLPIKQLLGIISILTLLSFNNIKSINDCQSINDKYNVNKRGFGEVPPQTRNDFRISSGASYQENLPLCTVCIPLWQK